MTRTPRIIAVGEAAEAGLRDSLITAFRRLGCEVEVLQLGPWTPTWLASAAYRIPLLGAGFRHDFRHAVNAMLDRRPADLVVVFKGAMLTRRSIDHLRAHFCCPVVCWNPDSPFDTAISNRGAGIPQAIPAYDAYITWAHDLAERLKLVARRVIVLPFAWDPELMRPAPGDGSARDRIVFIGTATKQRARLLRQLAHLSPLVYGTGWPDIHGVEIRPPVRGISFCRVAGEAKWNINLLRPQNALSHNMRSVRASRRWRDSGGSRHNRSQSVSSPAIARHAFTADWMS